MTGPSNAPPPWLSLLIPVYRVDEFLPACLASIFAQDLAGIEIVVVDDGGPPESAQAVAAIASQHPGVVRVVTHPANRGVSAARNTLLDQARGEYVWFVDPDDLLEADAIAQLKAIVQAQSPDLVMLDFRVIRHDPNQDLEGPESARRYRKRRRDAHVGTFVGCSGEKRTSTDELVRGLFAAGHMQSWSKVVRRAAWPASLRFPEGRVFEDLALFPRLALAVDSWYHAPAVWYAYRQRGGSLMTSLKASQLDDWMSALSGYSRELAATGRRFGDDTLFNLAHYRSQSLHTCLKKLREVGGDDVQRRGLARLAWQWTAGSPLGAGRVAWIYLRRLRVRQSLRSLSHWRAGSR